MMITSFRHGSFRLLCILSMPFIGHGQFFPNINIFDTLPVNGVCGVQANQTRETWPSDTRETNALCLYGEVDEFRRTNINSSNLNQTQQFQRRCKGLNGGSNVSCAAQGTQYFYTNELATSCGNAQGTPMMTTLAIPGSPFTNNNNIFLGNLCRTRTNSGTILPTAPVVFNTTPLGRVWQCPTYIGDPIECSAPRYTHGTCGSDANKGHTSVPTANLCAPGSVANIVQFDTQSQLRRWTCQGVGNGNAGFCQARPRFDTATLQPACNPSIVSIQSGKDTISDFVANDGCLYGTLGYRVVSGSGQAQRRCTNNSQETAFCANATFTPGVGALGTTCSASTMAKTYPTSHKLFEQGLCSDGTPGFFQDLGDKWSWTCGSNVCEAGKSPERFCGRATHEPTKMAPTQGLCQSGSVVELSPEIQTNNHERQRKCKYPSTQEIASCTTIKITDGVCKLPTTLKPEGYSHPSEIISAGLCEDGIANSQGPTPNMTGKVRSRNCLSSTPGGATASCQAKVRLPNTFITYDKPKPASGSIVGPVIARLSGYDPAYLTITSPLNQSYRLFTTTGQQAFYFVDRAGNTGMKAATVDWINPQKLGANLLFTPDGPSSGTISVGVTGVTHPLASFAFNGACLATTMCRLSDALDPERRTVIFQGNGEGIITLISTTGLRLDLPVSVTGIDKTKPLVNISYSSLLPTNQPVVATLTGLSEDIIVINNSGSRSYTFTGNGSFLFSFRDRAGNTGNATATVSRMRTTIPTAVVTYSSTGEGPGPIQAIVGNFSTSGITIVNNSGSNRYTFTYNHSFDFIIQDTYGNRSTITARVDRIRNNGLKTIVDTYNQQICAKFRKRYPVDIQGNENNLAIMTMLHNCIMRGYDDVSGISYFYPRNQIRRGEFLTIVGRVIRLMVDFDNPNLQELSTNFIGVNDKSQFGADISQADARGLLLYSPLMQSGTTKVLNLSGFVSTREAKYILTDAFKLVGHDHRILEYGMNEIGYLTRGDLSFLLNGALENRANIVIGNNGLFLQILYERINEYSYANQKKIILQMITKFNKIPEATFMRLGLHYNQLREDLLAAAQERIPTRQTRKFYNIKTIMDQYLMKIVDPSNNEIFNDKSLYTDMMGR